MRALARTLQLSAVDTSVKTRKSPRGDGNCWLRDRSNPNQEGTSEMKRKAGRQRIVVTTCVEGVVSHTGARCETGRRRGPHRGAVRGDGPHKNNVVAAVIAARCSSTWPSHLPMGPIKHVALLTQTSRTIQNLRERRLRGEDEKVPIPIEELWRTAEHDAHVVDRREPAHGRTRGHDARRHIGTEIRQPGDGGRRCMVDVDQASVVEIPGKVGPADPQLEGECRIALEKPPRVLATAHPLTGLALRLCCSPMDPEGFTQQLVTNDERMGGSNARQSQGDESAQSGLPGVGRRRGVQEGQ